MNLNLIKEKVTLYVNAFKKIECSKLTKYHKSPNRDLNFYIKGTCGIETAIMNVHFGLDTKDHVGWITRAKKIFEDNSKLFEETLKANKKIFILGGSLGAAVGAYLVNELLSQFPNKRKFIFGVFIASPKSVNRTIERNIHNNVITVLNPKDIITYVPVGDKYVVPGKIFSLRNNKFYNGFNLYKKASKKTFTIPMLLPYHLVTNYLSLILSAST